MIWLTGVVIVYAIALYTLWHAIMNCRSTHATIAWLVGLLLLPLLALPLYWTFGRERYTDYAERLEGFQNALEGQPGKTVDAQEEAACLLEKISDSRFSQGNRVELLIDAEATYPAIWKAIDSAERTVLVEYYLIRDDESGCQLRDRLVGAVERGCQVCLMYDSLGSYQLSQDYLDTLKNNGVDTVRFSGDDSRWFQRLRLNFRNHRKIVVVDGKVGFVGGLNIGDEHVYPDEDHGDWRDTHLRIEGPAVQYLQLIFAKDWYFARQSLPALDWNNSRAAGKSDILVAAFGPDKTYSRPLQFLLHLIYNAQQRIWISSPYFLPDRSVVTALNLAALGGVDVRVVYPQKTDWRVFDYVNNVYANELIENGVSIWRYEPGFIHQKVMLIDDHLSLVGSANFDFRSLFLNFEVAALVDDNAFANEVEAMLDKDFARSDELTQTLLDQRSGWSRFATRLCRLAMPVL